MKNNESILLTILGTVALAGVLLMINSTGKDNVGRSYVLDAISLDMVSGEEYLIYGRQVYLEYIDLDTTVFSIEGVSVKIPNGEKVNYDGLGIFSYGGEEIDASNKIYSVSVDFYR